MASSGPSDGRRRARNAGKCRLSQESGGEEAGGSEAVGDGAGKRGGNWWDGLCEQQQAGRGGAQRPLQMQDQRRCGHGIAQRADGLGSDQPGEARRTP
jgi:hypothetical protein